jgi:hypothetical protein
VNKTARYSKEHILSEILRTAEQNSGQPLGRQRFIAVTGIKESDWKGRYWVRWNDALAEAGFKPNALNARMPDETLLERLAALVRELGHFPVIGELKIKARSDPTFPSHNNFRRFGDKRAIAVRLQVFCTERGQHDVAALCALGGADEPTASAGGNPVPVVGFVYLLKSGRFYKIGRTNALGRRAYELAIQLPEKIEPVHSIKTDDPVGIEDYWHRRFQARRRNGEWFELTADDVSAFRRRGVM